MKLIFLDFDGVINNMRTYSQGPWHNRIPVDPNCMNVLNKIIEKTGAKVVISSSWRIFAKFDPTLLQQMLDREGFKGEVIATTGQSFQLAQPRKWKGRDQLWSQRGDEIKAWLDAQPEKHEFVVLDDDSDMEPVKDRFVQTSCQEGLQEKHLEVQSAPSRVSCL